MALTRAPRWASVSCSSNLSDLPVSGSAVAQAAGGEAWNIRLGPGCAWAPPEAMAEAQISAARPEKTRMTIAPPRFH